jgi:hypothetical protein
MRGRELTQVQPLDNYDALVGAQLPVELSVADVGRDHPGGAALEEPVREPARRRSCVEPPAAGHLDV